MAKEQKVYSIETTMYKIKLYSAYTNDNEDYIFQEAAEADDFYSLVKKYLGSDYTITINSLDTTINLKFYRKAERSKFQSTKEINKEEYFKLYPPTNPR